MLWKLYYYAMGLSVNNSKHLVDNRIHYVQLIYPNVSFTPTSTKFTIDKLEITYAKTYNETDKIFSYG